MESILEIIRKRKSVRTYRPEKPAESELNELMDYIKLHSTGPFGNTARFQFVEAPEKERTELKELGTYGMISGAGLYLAGAVKKTKMAMEDYGYCMEAAILKATALGLGTCWLGGTLNRSSFAKHIQLQDNEVIPAVTPVGYPFDKSGLKDSIMRMAIGANNRKPFENIFFNASLKDPLKREESGKYGPVLESLRLAPSASNRQPWIIIKGNGTNHFHFYLDEDKNYNNRFEGVRIQNIDMGIAVCHFDFSAEELGPKGDWKTEDPEISMGKLVYIASWIGK